MFSRALFYQLRDAATVINSNGVVYLRYSEWALELKYCVYVRQTKHWNRPDPDFIPTSWFIITFAADEGLFRQQTIDNITENTSPPWTTLAPNAIAAIQVRSVTRGYDDDPVFGLLEVRLVGSNSFELFAWLPSIAAAEQLAEVLYLITALPKPQTPSVTYDDWFRKIGRLLANHLFRR